MTLESAIRAGDVAAVSGRLRAGDDPNGRTTESLTPLMLAAGLGQPQTVEVLLTAGADVLAAEPRMGATALHKAVQSGETEVIGLLIDHGAFVDQQSPVLGNTPLMDAVLYKHHEAVQLLLDRGARTKIQNYWQQTALDLAREEGLDAVAGAIESKDRADAERYGALTLIAAAQAGDVAEVGRLLGAGVPVDERTATVGGLDDDYTALGIAARDGRADIARVLLDAGADPRRTIGLMKGTPLHEASYFGHAGVVRAMIDGRADAAGHPPALDAQGPYNGLTALHDAIWHGHREAARVLIEAGARLDLTTHAGLTPRGMAAAYGYTDIAELLADAEQARPADPGPSV